jgi:hypothetical protein
MFLDTQYVSFTNKHRKVIAYLLDVIGSLSPCTFCVTSRNFIMTCWRGRGGPESFQWQLLVILPVLSLIASGPSLASVVLFLFQR